MYNLANITTYKRGLATVEEQLITYRKNEVLFSEELAVLKMEVACKDYEINVLKSEFEKVKQEKEGIEFKIEKFDNASKSLNKLLESQITYKSKKGLGYNVVPPPHPLIYNQPKRLDLSYSDASKENSDDSLVKEQVSEDTSSFVESSLNVDKETIFLDKKIEFVKPKNHEKPVKKSVRPKAVNTARPHLAVVNAVRVNLENVVKASACWVWRPAKPNGVSLAFKRHNYIDARGRSNGYSRHMTGNIVYLSDFKEFDRGYVTFGGGAHSGRISGKGTLKTVSLDFEDVYFVNELNFNLFSVSQMCDKKNYVLFTDTECLVLYPNFKLPDESPIILKIPRKDNMYSFDMKSIVPKESLTCLDNLVRGLPTKRFENDQTCVACLKGKQHKASCKSKVLNPITKPLFMLHMDLFGPTFVSSLMHKKYCLVVIDDYSRFTWVFFLATKDETSEILKNFIDEIENLVDKKVKIIRSDNGTEFKNKVMDDFCREKADSKLPTTFWAEAVSIACYVQNIVLVVKPHNKTPYELFRGFKPSLSFMRPFGCHVTILNTLDSLGKFDGKSDEVAVGTISNESAGTQGELNAGTSTQKEEISQDCIVMPIWKDASYFDSPSKDVGNIEPKSATDDQKQVEDGPDNESDEKDKSDDDSSPKEVNAAGQHVNIVSPKVNTGNFKRNTVDPSVSTASSNAQDSPKDMFKLGASHTLEITHVEFFSDEDELEVDLGNIKNSYTIPTTPNTRIHKDHPIENVIGDMKLNPQVLLKLYLIHLGWKQCRKNFCNSNSNRCFKPALSFMRPFRCHSTILNTLDSLGKFDGKSDEGFFVGYSLSSKAFGIYNTRTRRVEENLHIGFLENKPMIEGNGPKWLFDIDSLTQSMNYVPVAACTITNESVDASYFDLPSKDVGNDEPKSTTDDQKQVENGPDNENDEKDKSEDDSSPKEVNNVNTASPEVNTGCFKLNIIDPSVNTASSYAPDSPKDMFKMGASHTLEATHVEFFSDEDEPEVDLGNILNSYTVPTTPNTRIHKDHPITNMIGDVKSFIQTRRMTEPTSEQGFLSAIYEQKTHDTMNTCLYACFLSHIEPTSIAKALSDSSWVEAMQEELLQFKLQQVWILVDLPTGKRATGTKWVFRNKKDERGIVIRNKKRFKRGKIDQTLFIKKHKGDILLVQVYVDDVILSSTNKDMCIGFEKLIKDKFQMSSMGELTFFLGLQVQQKEDGIFISQDKYVAEILKKFNYIDVKSASTPVDLEKPLVKDGDADDVDVHLYRSMIGYLMYFTTSRPDIMFAVCACARFQVTLKTSHLLIVKRIFRYFKGKPTLGLWYSRDSPFEIVAYNDSDYAGATQDKKSTTGGCQFLGNSTLDSKSIAGL
ncbi:putative ribonuclease H-like domain-containing protein [Tanacetum coccineum]